MTLYGMCELRMEQKIVTKKIGMQWMSDLAIAKSQQALSGYIIVVNKIISKFQFKFIVTLTLFMSNHDLWAYTKY